MFSTSGLLHKSHSSGHSYAMSLLLRKLTRRARTMKNQDERLENLGVRIDLGSGSFTLSVEALPRQSRRAGQGAPEKDLPVLGVGSTMLVACSRPLSVVMSSFSVRRWTTQSGSSLENSPILVSFVRAAELGEKTEFLAIAAYVRYCLPRLLDRLPFLLLVHVVPLLLRGAARLRPEGRRPCVVLIGKRGGRCSSTMSSARWGSSGRFSHAHR